MRISTRIVLDGTRDDLPVIECDSYEYDGPVAQCMPSDGAGGRSGGDGDRGSGGSTEGERGGGGGGEGGGGVGNRSASRGGMGAEDASGWGGGVGNRGGFDGTGANVAGKDASRDLAGNKTGRNPDGSFGPDHDGAIGKYADRYSSIGKWGGAALGAISGLPGGTLAGGLLGSALGKHVGEIADQEANIAAAQKGMPDSVRGFADTGRATNSRGESVGLNGEGGSEGGGMLTFSEGMNATYLIPKSAYDALVKAAQNDAATNAFLQTLNSAKSKGLVGSELIDHHNKNVDRMNAHSARVFGEGNYTSQQHASSTQTNPTPKQYALKHSVAQQALDEIEEAKGLGARIVIK